MSFDLCLTGFRSGEIAAGDRDAARAVVDGVDRTAPDAFGFVIVDFPGGGSVELSAKGLFAAHPFDSAMFFLRGLDLEIAGFIFAFADAARFAMIDVQSTTAAMTLTPPSVSPSDLPASLAQHGVAPVASGAAVLAGLDASLGAWASFRDRAVGPEGAA